MHLLIDSVMMNSPGGIQLRDELVKSAAEQAPENCDITVLVSEKACKLVNSGKLRVIPVSPPESHWFGKWKWYHRSLPEIAKQHEADVVYSLGSGIVSRQLCDSFGVVNTVNTMLPFTPLMMQSYPLFSRARFRYVMLRRVIVKSIKMADTVVLHSQHALDMISRYTGDIASKSHVVLTGVPRDMNCKQVAASAHPYQGAPYYFYLSAVYSYKNHLRLIEAYRQALSEKRDLPDLLIAGIPADKDYLNTIQAEIKNAGLDNKVKYLGILDRKDIPAWIYHAEVNYFPSVCETNSIVLAEILGLGGALACSGISSIAEVVV